MRRSRIGSLVLVLVVALGAVALTGVGARAQTRHAATFTPLTSVGYDAHAYGTRVVVGSLLKSGPTAPTGLGCTETPGLTHSNTAATLNVPAVATAGVIDTTAQSLAGPAATSSATIASLNLLDGAVTASAVTAVSTVSADSTGFHDSAAGSSFASLSVGGVPTSATPAPNTTINLPGIKVVLNEQTADTDARSAHFTVNMIHVTVAATGADIIIGHAQSGLGRAPIAFLDGHAYATSADILGGTVLLGHSAPVVVPCAGDNGKLRTNTLASVSLPGVLSTGALTDTATGTATSTGASSATTSTIQAINLLSGLITADVIEAAANASKTSSGITLSDTGSRLLNLTINGTPIAASAPANTRINIGNITIWVHRVIKESTSIEVRMLEIVVKGPNAFGLSPNTDVRVAVAEASVH